MPTRLEELTPIAERVGLRPGEIAALCLLRRRGDSDVRGHAFQAVLDELHACGTADPLVVAALVSLLAAPDLDSRVMACAKGALLFNGTFSVLEGRVESASPNEHYRAVRLACSRLPRTFEVILGLATEELVKGLIRVGLSGTLAAPTATEGEMEQGTPAGGQIVSLTLPVETVAALSAQAESRGQTLEVYLQHLAAFKALSDDATGSVRDAEFDQLLDELHQGPEVPSLPAGFSRADIYAEHD